MTFLSLRRTPLACALLLCFPCAAAAFPTAPSASPSDASLATAVPQAATAPPGATPPDHSRAKTLPRVVVDANADMGYRAVGADSTTRTSVPLKDLPASIQVVPREVLADRGVTRTDQLLDNISGVLAESSYGGNGATFFNIRGFSENNGLRDGFREYGYLAFRDVQNIERVEVRGRRVRSTVVSAPWAGMSTLSQSGLG